MILIRFNFRQQERSKGGEKDLEEKGKKRSKGTYALPSLLPHKQQTAHLAGKKKYAFVVNLK